ncbi:MAG: RcnB family protein [Pigmentiphaga sp.]|uniref:RcnB family protein n=1 Tax=Pigmentiphaga sp. TaxID=1977564 RepID=UPI0029AD83E4|nr:RcnB family protein [Pigmentiphaga sp.]MDX3905182.1 RcnB family protein [Pigmentiphaga sp.]
MAAKRLLAQLLIGTLLAASTAAYAQGGPPGGRPGNGPGMGGRGHDGPGHSGMNRPAPGGPGHMGPGPSRPPVHAHPGGRADPPYHRWAKGDRVPLPYRGPQYVVDDWRGHRLSPPPRGYRWISVGPDYFLVAIATGLVLQAILNP